MLDPLSNQPAPFSSQPMIVRDHIGVDLLLKVNALRQLRPYLQGEHTLGSAARVADVPASSHAYWVQRFLRAGLIEVTRLQPRAGKSIPHYRAVASEFQVPFDAMPPGTRDEFLLRGRQFAFDQFIAASNQVAAAAYRDSGIRIVATAERGVELSFVEPADVPEDRTTEWWGMCTLNDAEATELSRALKALQERFGQDREGPGRTRYHLVLGFAPALRA